MTSSRAFVGIAVQVAAVVVLAGTAPGIYDSSKIASVASSKVVVATRPLNLDTLKLADFGDVETTR